MLDTLISSKTRVKLLLKFFLNAEAKAYLRGLEAEFGESSNAIRLELNKLEEAGLLQSENVLNKKFFTVNTLHPLFKPIQNLVRSYVGIDEIVENVAKKLGEVKEVYLLGDFARGLYSEHLEIALIGDHIDELYLRKLVDKAEQLLNKKIIYRIYISEGLNSISHKLLIFKV